MALPNCFYFYKVILRLALSTTKFFLIVVPSSAETSFWLPSMIYISINITHITYLQFMLDLYVGSYSCGHFSSEIWALLMLHFCLLYHHQLQHLTSNLLVCFDTIPYNTGTFFGCRYKHLQLTMFDLLFYQPLLRTCLLLNLSISTTSTTSLNFAFFEFNWI